MCVCVSVGVHLFFTDPSGTTLLGTSFERRGKCGWSTAGWTTSL